MQVDLRKLSILIVSESVRLRRLIFSILNTNKIKIIHETGSAQEGYLKICELSISMVIADWNTGALNGIELTHKIRHEAPSSRRNIPIILIVDENTDLEHINQMRDAGVTGLLLKPFSAHHLLKQIKFAATDPRQFIEYGTYVGPDRRRKSSPDYAGPFRRSSDK